MQSYPLKFEAIYKETIWGGNKLCRRLHKNFPADKNIGESWELVDLPNDNSKISNGKWAGRTISEILQQFPKEILGKDSYEPPFGLLIKFIDANDVLSVQVHPDADTAKTLPNARLKTECWYIIDAAEGAFIYKGLKAGVSKQQFETAIKDGSCAELLNKVPTKTGHCHFLPAGTVHAIGAGNLIAEIQTPSDTTYRVFDFNRLQNGKPRQLHISEAMQSIHFNQDPDVLTVKGSGRLVDCDLFKVDKYTQTTSLPKGTAKVLVSITADGKITAGGCDDVNFQLGQTVLLPAELEVKIDIENNGQYLIATV